MRWSAVVVLVLTTACGAPPGLSPPVRGGLRGPAGCITAWSARKARSAQAVIPPSSGGYRRLDAAHRAALGSRIEHEGHAGPIDAYTFNALSAAFHDDLAELRGCLRRGDPDAQRNHYVLTVSVIGDRRVGALVADVSVEGLRRTSGEPAEVSSTAVDCIRSRLMMIELPAGGGPASLVLPLEVDECTP